MPLLDTFQLHISQSTNLISIFCGLFLWFFLLQGMSSPHPLIMDDNLKLKERIINFKRFCRYVVGLVVLFKGVNANEYCSWCHYLSCIPTSKWKCNNMQVFCQVINEKNFIFYVMKWGKIHCILGFMQASQTGDQLSLECVNGGKMGNYKLVDDNPSTIKQLCYELCSWLRRQQQCI